jgi:predicted TIM-barrel fold metal-dependent hydrolase
MNNEQEIAEIVIQLQRLQLQQSELLQRITQVSVDNNNNNAARQANTPRAAQAANTPRNLVIGDWVRINNPNRFQANIGRIIKIGRQVTVQAKNGTKIHRAAKNLTLDN